MSITVTGATGPFGRRADLAEAAAAVIAGDAHPNTVYELGGTPFTLSELAAEISRVSGREVHYTDLSQDAYASMLIAAGVPEPMAAALADTQRAAAHGPPPSALSQDRPSTAAAISCIVAERVHSS